MGNDKGKERAIDERHLGLVYFVQDGGGNPAGHAGIAEIKQNEDGRVELHYPHSFYSSLQSASYKKWHPVTSGLTKFALFNAVGRFIHENLNMFDKGCEIKGIVFKDASTKEKYEAHVNARLDNELSMIKEVIKKIEDYRILQAVCVTIINRLNQVPNLKAIYFKYEKEKKANKDLQFPSSILCNFIDKETFSPEMLKLIQKNYRVFIDQDGKELKNRNGDVIDDDLARAEFVLDQILMSVTSITYLQERILKYMDNGGSAQDKVAVNNLVRRMSEMDFDELPEALDSAGGLQKFDARRNTCKVNSRKILENLGVSEKATYETLVAVRTPLLKLPLPSWGIFPKASGIEMPTMVMYSEDGYDAYRCGSIYSVRRNFDDGGRVYFFAPQLLEMHDPSTGNKIEGATISEDVAERIKLAQSILNLKDNVLSHIKVSTEKKANAIIDVLNKCDQFVKDLSYDIKGKPLFNEKIAISIFIFMKNVMPELQNVCGNKLTKEWQIKFLENAKKVLTRENEDSTLSMSLIDDPLKALKTSPRGKPS